MTKPMNRVRLLKLIKAAGYVLARSDGPHDVYVCTCGEQHELAPLPRHTEISPGVVRQISKCAHMNRKDFP